MKPCIYCKQTLIDTAEVCHYCSRYQKQWKQNLERCFSSVTVVIALIAMGISIWQANSTSQQTKIAGGQLDEARRERISASEALEHAKEAKNIAHKASNQAVIDAKRIEYLKNRIEKQESDTSDLYDNLIQKNKLASKIIKKLEYDFYRVKDIKAYLTVYFIKKGLPDKFGYALSNNAMTIRAKNDEALVSMLVQTLTKKIRSYNLIGGHITPDGYKDPIGVRYDLSRLHNNTIRIVEDLEKIGYIQIAIFWKDSHDFKEIIPLISKMVIDIEINGLAIGKHEIAREEIVKLVILDQSTEYPTYRINYNIRDAYKNPRELYDRQFLSLVD